MDPKAYMPSTRTQMANLICSNCFRVLFESLSKCSGCRRVGYCDTTWQSEDWKDHKQICKSLRKVNAYDKRTGHTFLNPSRRLEYYIREEVILGVVH
jgi:hypothetical protein